MLLSIDRVLQLLAEGKSVQKIAELSHAEESDVCKVIEEARKLLQSKEKLKTKKKIIFKRKGLPNFEESSSGISVENDKIETEEIFEGAELSAVPLGSYLLVYTDGASSGNPGHSGIGIVINDKEDRMVGKVSSYIGINTNNYAEYTALIRALKIAIYFKTKELKIRTDSELIVKQIKGEYKVTSDTIKPLFEKAVKLKKKISNCRIEHIPRSLNEKADYLAKMAVETITRQKY
ncbi:MAG: ribonuclease HI family protein [Spirochaetes bacterium]|nr:ribonuclease HI family protein [Spirochaetota bacterium]